MDADTRHDLKKNELAEALSQLHNLANPTTRYTLMGLALIVALFIGWKAWGYTRQQAMERASQRLGAIQAVLAGNEADKKVAAVSDLRTLIDDTFHPGVAGAARLLLARVLTDEAVEKPDRRQAALTETVDILQKIISRADTPASIEAAATFALATNCESLAALEASARQSRLSQAAELYEKLKQDPRFKGSPYVDLAAERLQTIDQLKTPIVFTPGQPPAPPQPPGQQVMGPSATPSVFQQPPPPPPPSAPPAAPTAGPPAGPAAEPPVQPTPEPKPAAPEPGSGEAP